MILMELVFGQKSLFNVIVDMDFIGCESHSDIFCSVGIFMNFNQNI